MISIRRNTQYIIIFAIFVISIGVGLKKSNLLKGTRQTVDTKETDKMFKEKDNYTKISLRYNIDMNADVTSEIVDVLSDEGISKIYSQQKPTLYSVIAEIPVEKSNDILKKFREIQGLSEENIVLNESATQDINVEAHIKNNKFLIERTKEDISTSRVSYTERIRDSKNLLNKIQTEIDSLQNLIILQEHNRAYDLLYVAVIKGVGSSDMSGKVQAFLKTFALVLIVLIVGLVLLYFILLILTKLMVVMGIKTAKSSGGAGGYNYKYYRRGYGRYGRPYRRRSKRAGKSDNEE